MNWLTTALGASAIAGFAALLGVLVKGILDNRLAARALEVQRVIAIAQIQTQENIAVANRAEGRALAMLDFRRTRYAEVVGLAVVVTTALVRQRDLLGSPDLPEYPSPDLLAEWDAWTRPDAVLPISDAARAYGEIVAFDKQLSDSNHALKQALLPMQIIASNEVVTLAGKLVGRDLVTSERRNAAGAAEEVDRQTQVLAAYMLACQAEIGEARPSGTVVHE